MAGRGKAPMLHFFDPFEDTARRFDFSIREGTKLPVGKSPLPSLQE